MKLKPNVFTGFELSLWLLGIMLLTSCATNPQPSATVPSSAPTTAVSMPTTAPPAPTLDPNDRPKFDVSGWKTDFAKHAVPYQEITSGGPPRDGIAPIDHPKFVAPTEAAGWLKDNEPVILVVLNGDARAYPLQILIWHEITNDTVGSVPVTVTFCPLCNTAIVFDRSLGGTLYDFGTTGKLRYSDLVMWDRQTESWWQQATGEAIVGTLTGMRLKPLPAAIVSFADFRRSYPAGKVLSRDTGFERNYGRNPYVGYDDVESSPFLFKGTPDARLRPMERVVALTLGEADVAYPYTVLSQQQVLNDAPGGRPVVVLWQRGTSSALDGGSIAGSRDIGATGVFERAVDGRTLTFRAEGDGFVDAETGTRWNVLGQAVEGPLKGRQLEPVVHVDVFWFAWAAFKPGTRVYQ